ncbi:rIIA lysis inhibitor [Escherichia phage AV116]|nr:rIIA lysis inhibitor [Escherichia phage AV116]
MIIETAKETIIGSGGKSTAFTIQGNSKVYKILSNDLYTNKELACVRELITNCIDGQILNGCTDKFIVQAPGRLDPRFVVRDFGPGMSDFTIRGNDEEPGIYNSYFASTKTSSNDFIGGFGLGSKAPLAYTDTFNLTSYHNGEVRGYVIYQDDTGPQIKPTFVDKMGPDDRTGVEVVVPVNPEDFEKFASEIAYVMRPLGDIAEVRGVKDIKYFPEFDDVYLAKEAPWGERGNIMAVYGGIVYPIGSVIKEQTWMMTRCTLRLVRMRRSC